jgi:UDP-glucose-4-epimerase GalE
MDDVSHVLVTGGAGYIGSHTCKALAKAGYTPVTIDNLVYGHRSAVKWGPFIEGDLADEELLCQIMHDYKVQAVMHFAAYAYVGESMQTPGKYFRNNVTNTLNLLNAMVYSGVQKIVFSSSCATYGMPQQLPINESHPQHPVNPYGESKLFVEKALRWYDNAHSIRSASLRYFNAAGADLDGEIGEDHKPETHLIPLVIQNVLSKQENVQIFGTDYDTSDGSAVRDYIHVTDLASAHVKAIDHLTEDGNSVFLNLGTGKGYSVKEVIKMVEEVSGNRINVNEVSRRAGDPPVLVAQCDLANELLCWEPQCSDLRTIITSALQWHQKDQTFFSPLPETETMLEKSTLDN